MRGMRPAYVGIAPRDFRITLPSGKMIKAEEALRDAVFERRSCGNGSKGPRYSDWALIATASDGGSWGRVMAAAGTR